MSFVPFRFFCSGERVRTRFGAAPDLTSRTEERATDLNQALRGLLDDVCRSLGVPLALLSRDHAGWRFEAEAFPPRPVADAPRFRAPATEWLAGIGP